MQSVFYIREHLGPSILVAALRERYLQPRVITLKKRDFDFWDKLTEVT
jgi:hypothetical protein